MTSGRRVFTIVILTMFLLGCQNTPKNSTRYLQSISTSWHNNGFTLIVEEDAPLILLTRQEIHHYSRTHTGGGAIGAGLAHILQNAMANKVGNEHGQALREKSLIMSPGRQSMQALEKLFHHAQLKIEEDAETRLLIETKAWRTEALGFLVNLEMRLYPPGRISAAVRSQCYYSHSYEQLKIHVDEMLENPDLVKIATQAGVESCTEYFLTELQKLTPPLRGVTAGARASAP